MRAIISGSFFVDGAKWTGFEVKDVILTANGYVITGSNGEIMELDEIID